MIWSIGAEIFVPAAASRLLSQNQLDQMIDNDLEVISSGANVPFADKEIFFGPISKRKLSLDPFPSIRENRKDELASRSVAEKSPM